ncbi:MAG: serine/threonine protein kinase [Pseudomonadales bacterium]
MSELSAEHPFDKLTPEFILDAIESVGLVSDARVLTLNSYENRVYQVGIEDSEPLIAKFYRPDRWSRAQILEEHRFTAELQEAEIDVVAPLAFNGSETLFDYQDFSIALFPRCGGRTPDLEGEGVLAVIGRLLGRLHALGRTRKFDHRPAITLEAYGVESIEFLRDNWVPAELQPAYASLSADLIACMQAKMDELKDVATIRTHSDFHIGNMIVRDDRIFMVDFDDTRSAPAIQDIWMLLSGDDDERARQLDVLLSAYGEFYDFDWRETRLIEVYRTLRLLYFSAWIGRRWNDPAFPKNFPWFDSPRYWSEHVLTLREQLALLQQGS